MFTNQHNKADWMNTRERRILSTDLTCGSYVWDAGGREGELLLTMVDGLACTGVDVRNRDPDGVDDMAVREQAG